LALLLVGVSPLPGRGCEVAPGGVAIDPLVDAGGFIGLAHGDEPPRGLLGFARLAAMATRQPVAEPALGVEGTGRKVFRTGSRDRQVSPSTSCTRAISAKCSQVV
jgi:hypothetical protein